MDKLQNAIDKCAPVFVTEYGTTNDIAQGDFNPVRSQQWYVNLPSRSFIFNGNGFRWDLYEKNKLSYLNWAASDKA